MAEYCRQPGWCMINRFFSLIYAGILLIQRQLYRYLYMRKSILQLVIGGIFILTAFPCTAQQKQPGSRQVPGEKGLVPVYTSSLGNVLSNTLPVSMMRNLLDSALIARDKQGHAHPVVSFDFGYRTSDTFNDDTTGKPRTSYLYSGFHFNSSKLDSLWRTRVSKNIRPGDELFFDHIIARNEKGIHYLSSPLHFIVR